MEAKASTQPVPEHLPGSEDKELATAPSYGAFPVVEIEFPMDGTLHLSDDFRIHAMSATAQERLGIPSQVLGQSLEVLSHPGDASLFGRMRAQIRQHGYAGPVLFRLRTREGHYKWVEMVAQPHRDEQGTVNEIVVHLRDVSQRVRTEEERARLAAVVEQVDASVIITDNQGRIIYVNPAFEYTTGYSRDEVIGQTPGLWRSGQHSAEFYRQLWDTLLAGQPWHGIFVNRRKDGRLYYDQAVVFPVYAPDGRLQGYASVQRDITADVQRDREREAMIATARALRHVHTLEEIVPVVLDQVMSLMDADGAALCLLDEHETHTEVVAAVGEFASLQDSRLSVQEGLTGYVVRTGEVYLSNAVRADPRLRRGDRLGATQAAVGVPLLVQEKVLGVLWAGRTDAFNRNEVHVMEAIADMAASALQRARLYAELERHAAELEVRVAERTRELEQAYEELRTLDRLKTKFVQDVSHELRTPIANLKLYLELFLRGAAERRDHYQHALEESVARLNGLVEDVLGVLHLGEYAERQAGFGPVSLTLLLEQLAAVYRLRAAEQGLDLVVHIPSHLPTIRGDFDLLARMLGNILTNALQYTEQGHLALSAAYHPQRGQVEIRIADTGTGIAPEDLPHVTQRFYRGAHRARDIPGTGLGLAIAQEIAALHGGSLQVESRPGQGTQVRIVLPVDEEQGDGQEGGSAPATNDQ